MQEYKSTITGKRQITIPIEICKLLKLEKGNQAIFRMDEDKIIFDVEKEYIDCFICNGTSKIDKDRCFICDGSGLLNKTLIRDTPKFIGELIVNSIKYGICIIINKQEIDTSNKDNYKQILIIELKSDRYSVNELITIQNKIQKFILEDEYD